MRSFRVSLLTIILFSLAGVFVWQALSAHPERRAFINGKVLTMDSNNTVHEAVLIDKGRIIAAGSNDQISAELDKYTRVTNLNGKTLMPGIIDAHGHFPGSGLTVFSADLNSPPIGSVQTIADLQAKLGGSVETASAGEWVLGMGYDDTLLDEKRHPTRSDLDAVSTKHPIFIVHVSGHMGVANSLALERAGISGDSVNPEGGVIVRDANGELTGLLEENAAAPVQRQAMDFGAMDFLKMIRYAAAEYASMGVTTAQSGGVDARMYNGLRYASKFGLVKSRLVVFPMSREMGSDYLENRSIYDAQSTERFLLGPVKIVADGSIQGYTGYLQAPYHQPYHGDSSYRGYPRVPLEQLIEDVDRYRKHGIQLAIHGNGDASIDDIITAFATAQRKYPDPDPRLILIHSQMSRADQLNDFKQLGITPSFFSAHTYYWGDRHRDIFMGPERASNMSPAKWALERDLRFSIHLDTPVVPMQPFLLVWSAVNRRSSSGETIGPAQQIQTMQALRAVTIDAAWQIFQEDNRGSIEPGKWADVIVLSGDPLMNTAAIKDIEVLETLVAGETIFER